MNSSPEPSDLFICPLCLQPYNHPKVLPCLHSFCDVCLHKELPSQSFTLLCPVCRHQFILPPEGISSFQTNPLISKTISMGTTTDNPSGDEDWSNPQDIYCSSHARQSLRFYCNACDSAICSSCLDIEHQGHQTVRIDVAAVDQQEKLQQILNILKDIVQSKETNSDRPVEEDSRLQATVDSSFEEVFNVIKAWKTDIHRNVDPILHATHSSRRMTDIQTYGSKLNLLSCTVSATESVLKQGNPLCVILLKKQLEATADLFKPVDRKSSGSRTVAFKSPTDSDAASTANFREQGHLVANVDDLVVELSGALTENCQAVQNQNYRIIITVRAGENDIAAGTEVLIPLPRVQVRGPLQEDPSLLSSRPEERRLASSSQNSISSQTENAMLQKSPSPVRRISCPLHHVSTSNCNTSSRPTSVANQGKLRKQSLLLSLNVRSLTDNTFETIVTFPQAGRYEVDIMLSDNPVDGSPLKVEVCSLSGLRKKLTNDASSQKLNGSGRSSSPQTMLPDILIEEEIVCRIGCRGRGKGQFTNPQDICATSTGRILATDSNNQCVQVFTDHGEMRFTERGRLPIQRGRLMGMIQRPTGIAVLPESDKYVVADYENRWISTFEPNGKFVSRFGMGKLLGPKGVATDGAGKIYVVDNKSSSIFIFQTNGRFVGKFGSRGGGSDHLAGPHFIGINSFGHAVVSDFHNHAVKVFDSTGQFLYSFGGNGEGDGEFNAPTGIAVDRFDNILVADWGNSRIQVFDRQGTFLQSLNSKYDPLYGPQGLTLSPAEDFVYVADSGNHCIKVLKYDNCVTNVAQVD